MQKGMTNRIAYPLNCQKFAVSPESNAEKPRMALKGIFAAGIIQCNCTSTSSIYFPLHEPKHAQTMLYEWSF